MADRGRRVPRETRHAGFLKVFAWLLIPLLRAAATVRAEGTEHVPLEGPFIVAPNHHSDVDPIVVGAVVWRLGRIPRFLAKASLFRIPVVGAALRAAGQIPVERGGLRAAAPLEIARTVAERGEAVVIYPEGSMTRDPGLWPMRGKTGAARLALAGGIPVIPVAHWGTQGLMEINTNRIHLRPRARITVRFGAPVPLDDLADRPTDPLAQQEATRRIMAAITALLESLRGERAPAERWDPAAHGQSETGRF